MPRPLSAVTQHMLEVLELMFFRGVNRETVISFRETVLRLHESPHNPVDSLPVLYGLVVRAWRRDMVDAVDSVRSPDVLGDAARVRVDGAMFKSVSSDDARGDIDRALTLLNDATAGSSQSRDEHASGKTIFRVLNISPPAGAESAIKE